MSDSEDIFQSLSLGIQSYLLRFSTTGPDNGTLHYIPGPSNRSPPATFMSTRASMSETCWRVLVYISYHILYGVSFFSIPEVWYDSGSLLKGCFQCLAPAFSGDGCAAHRQRHAVSASHRQREVSRYVLRSRVVLSQREVNKHGHDLQRLVHYVPGVIVGVIVG